ncbi:uncharacterized protein LOC141915121 isoform X2 [Tubulanus polymorphus]|uniref:uncharacterized protein LOC141915121 isoform X2 n=1 Tax=Tubulanus polymorphus TaxID=672921 RepID=UPI003DA38E8E
MSGVQLKPLDGVDQPINVSLGKTTIGRGPYLRVPDKKVSRQHACLEVEEGGKLKLTPIHTNPCYFRKLGNTSDQVTLPINVPIDLCDGDVFGLLPDQYFFKVVYTNTEKKEVDGTQENGHMKDKKTKDVKQAAKQPDKSNKDKDDGIEETNEAAKNTEKEVALPLDKKRKLPDWMGGSGPAKKGKTDAKKDKKKEESEEEEEGDDDIEDEEEEVIPQKKVRKAPTSRTKDHDVSDDDDSATKTKGKGRGRPKAGAVKGRKRKDESDNEEESDDDSPPRRLPGRKASQNKPKYGDDYVSDEEQKMSESDEDYEAPSNKKGDDDDDSDFVMDEDSASDWEKPTTKKGGKKGGKTPTKDTSRRRGRPKAVVTPSRKPPGRAVKGKKRYSDSELDDEDFDDYIPRPSKRRAAAKAAEVAAKKQQQDSDSASENEDDDGPRKSCQYGKKCFRKNPAHFKEFGHPGDSDYEENAEEDDDEGESEEETPVKKGGKNQKKHLDEMKPSRPKRSAAPTKMKGTSDNEDEEEDEEMEEKDAKLNDSSSKTDSKDATAAAAGDESNIDEDKKTPVET